MKRYLLAAAVAATPVMASAQGVSTSIGFALVSEYVAGGLKQSDGPAFQPYVELGYNGFYAGIWASNVDGTLANTPGDDFEIDLYAGYRGEMGPVSYDIGYFRYYYNDDGDCCGELILNVGYSIGERVSMNTVLFTDLEGGAAIQQKFSVDLGNDFSVSGDVKARNNDGRTSWSLGVGKSLGSAAVDIRYHDSDVSDPVYTVGLSWGTSFGG